MGRAAGAYSDQPDIQGVSLIPGPRPGAVKDQRGAVANLLRQLCGQSGNVRACDKLFGAADILGQYGWCSGGKPCASSFARRSGKVRLPMKTTVEAVGSASAVRLMSPGNLPVTSWPVTNWTRRAVRRRVSGMPAAAAAATAEGMPGMIS